MLKTKKTETELTMIQEYTLYSLRCRIYQYKEDNFEAETLTTAAKHRGIFS